jgi:hypothetical protein
VKKIVLVSVVLFLMVGAPAWGATLNFGELPNQPVNGLSYMGVTFSFDYDMAPSDDAQYNVDMPSLTFANMESPFLAGPTKSGTTPGLLSLNFAVPTPYLSFWVSLNTPEELTGALRVALFDASGNMFGPIYVDTENLGGAYPEGQFSYTGTPLGGVDINFVSDNATYFYIDNLTYSAVPLPGAVWLLGSGFVGLGAWRRFKKS